MDKQTDNNNLNGVYIEIIWYKKN